MDVDEQCQQPKQRKLKGQHLEKASHCFPALLLHFQIAYYYVSGAFS